MSFAQFDRVLRPHLRRLYPEATTADLNQVLVMRWNDLSPAEQAEFVPPTPSTPVTRSKVQPLPKTPSSPCGKFQVFARTLVPFGCTPKQRKRALRKASELWKTMSNSERRHFA